MKKILMVTAVMLLLTGCGGKDTTTVCKSATSNGMSIVGEINATGDKVSKTKETGELDFSDDSVYKDVVESDIEAMAKELEKQYSGVNGAEFKYTVNDKKMEYTITFDYEKADLDELQEKKFITFEEEGKVKYISLKATVNGYEEQEMTCEKQK